MKRILASAGVALLLSACNIGGGSDSAASKAAGPVGGTLRVGITEPVAIDPANAYDPSGKLIVETMCDSLVELHPRTGELEPGLVRSFSSETASNGVFTLRKGLKFPNGDGVDVDDVVFSLSRVVKEASPVAEDLSAILGYEIVHGDVELEDEDNPAIDKLLGIVRITNEAFSISHNSPDGPDYLRILAEPLGAIVPEDLGGVTAEEFAARPVCAGPYQLAGPWSPGDPQIVLERSSDYHGKHAAFTAGGAGYADRIEFKVYPDSGAALAGYRAGEVDLVPLANGQITAIPPAEGEVVISPTATVDYIGVPAAALSSASPPAAGGSPPADANAPANRAGDTAGGAGQPAVAARADDLPRSGAEVLAAFSKPPVRIALSMALDRNKIVQRVYGGGRLPATSLLPPTVGDGRLENGCGGAIPATPDLEGARALLARAGVDLSGDKVVLYFNNEFGHERLMAEVGAQWKAAFGLEPQLVPLAWDDYVARASSGTGLEGAFRVSWRSPYPSSLHYLRSLFSASQVGQNNFQRFTLRDFDRAIERKITPKVDLEERELETKKLEEMVCEHLPLIPVTYAADKYLVRSAALGSGAGAFADRNTGRLLLRELYRAKGA